MPYKFRVTPDIAFVSLFIMLIICILYHYPDGSSIYLSQ